MGNKKMLTLLAIVTLILMLGTLPFMAACAEPEPTPAPTPTPTPAPSPEYPEIEIKFAMAGPSSEPDDPPYTGYEFISQELQKLTGGKIKIVYYPNKALATVPEQYDAVVSGRADMAGPVFKPYYKRWPLTTLFDLPTISFPSTVDGYIANENAVRTLHNEFPEVQAYLKDVKALGFTALPRYFIHSKKEIRVPEDMKGLRVAASGALGDYVTLSEGAAVMILIHDAYMALKTGQIDATIADWNSTGHYSLFEVAPYHLDNGFGGLHFLLMFNQDTWNRLPADVQELFIELLPQGARIAAQDHIKFVEAAKKDTLDYGNNAIYTPTSEEKALWDAVGEKVEEKWLADMEAAGAKSAAEMLTRYKQLAAEAWGK